MRPGEDPDRQRPGRHRQGQGRDGKSAAAGPDDEAFTWPALSAAVGLLTARRACREISQAELLGDEPPERMISALVALAGALLGSLPGDSGTRVLQGIALLAAMEGTAPQP